MSISENDVLSPRLHIWEGIELDNGIEIYSLMLRSRFFEEKVRDLFASGEMYGTTHLNIGQEASHTGARFRSECDVQRAFRLALRPVQRHRRIHAYE